MSFVSRANECIAEIREFEKSYENPHFPYLILNIERMLAHLDDDSEKKRGLVGAYGRLLMDDWPFANSPFGLKLAQLGNDYLNFTPRQLREGIDADKIVEGMPPHKCKVADNIREGLPPPTI